MKKTLPRSESRKSIARVRHDGTALALVLALAGAGCSGLSNTQRGALIGAGAGGAVGAVIGNAAGSTTKGAIIGAAVGGAAGAIIGSRMNDRAETLAAELPNATIERVGEGILVTFDSGILFGFDSSDLRAQARNNLGDLARVLAEDSDDYELLVAGHTDASGAEAYNQTLSERRASAASDHLATQGIPSTQIRIQGLGETEPWPRTRPHRVRRPTGASRSRSSRVPNTATRRSGKPGTDPAPRRERVYLGQTEHRTRLLRGVPQRGPGSRQPPICPSGGRCGPHVEGVGPPRRRDPNAFDGARVAHGAHRRP